MTAAAHDLTTPLAGMRMMIGRNDAEAKRLNERMLRIVNNLKDFLKLGGKRRKPDLKPVDIVARTKEAYQLFAADYADSESGDVAFLCSSSPSPFLYANKGSCGVLPRLRGHLLLEARDGGGRFHVGRTSELRAFACGILT